MNGLKHLKDLTAKCLAHLKAVKNSSTKKARNMRRRMQGNANAVFMHVSIRWMYLVIMRPVQACTTKWSLVERLTKAIIRSQPQKLKWEHL